MGFLESLAIKIATVIADRVYSIIEARIQKAYDYGKINEKRDREKNEMIKELAQADTQEERDAILDKIHSSLPDFE